jgi:hypothetical protein
MTKHPLKPWEQAVDKLREKPGQPSLRQAFDKLHEKPGQPSLRQAFEIDLTPREPPPLPTKPPPKPPPKRTRKKGAGHPRWLTDDEITRSQNIVRRALRKSPKLVRKTNDDLTEHFRPLFTFKRKVSDRTLWRYIIGPLVGPRRTKKPPA